jgi:putative Mn2+ efflux pump MntP
MSILELLLISIGLAMDCFAVSFSAGATQKELKLKNILIIAFSFGLFQGGMPILGWLGGELVVEHICHTDHWIAFGILLLSGEKCFLTAFDRIEMRKKLISAILLHYLFSQLPPVLML